LIVSVPREKMIAQHIGTRLARTFTPEQAKKITDTGDIEMRRSLSILAAAAIALGASVATLSPAMAAMPRLAPGATDTSSAIIQVQRWENFHGDRHNAFRDDGWDRPRWRHQRRHNRFGHHRFRRHEFGFPFAFRPHFYPYPSRRDCFRTWDGQLICRGYW
jgi:hypothetical protein